MDAIKAGHKPSLKVLMHAKVWRNSDGFSIYLFIFSVVHLSVALKSAAFSLGKWKQVVALYVT